MIKAAFICFTILILMLLCLFIINTILTIEVPEREIASYENMVRQYEENEEKITSLVNQKISEVKAQRKNDAFSRWLTFSALFGAIVLPLIGPQLNRYYERKRKQQKINRVLFHNLGLLLKLLERILLVKNRKYVNPADPIMFDETSLSEVSHFDFLFSDIILKDIDDIDILKHQSVLNFFSHYTINMATLRERQKKGHCHLTRGTVVRLIERLDKAIKELNINEAIPELPG